MPHHTLLQIMLDGDQQDAEIAAWIAGGAIKRRAKLIDSASVTWTISPDIGEVYATAAGGPGGGMTQAQALTLVSLRM